MIEKIIHPEAFMWSSELQQTIIQRCKAVQYRLQEPLSRHTSFRIGGPAAVMAFPKTTEELKQLLQGAAAAGAQPYILGAGTNILAPDEGLDALVICLKDALCGIRLLDEARIEAYAGESMAKAAVFAKNHALTGLEFAHGIPGTLGGGVYMNAGAYGGELKQVVESVTILTMDGEEKTLSGEECAFGYRTSVYQKQHSRDVGGKRWKPPHILPAKTVEDCCKALRSSTPYIPRCRNECSCPDGGLDALICLKDALCGIVSWMRDRSWRRRLSLPRTTRAELNLPSRDARRRL